MMSGDGSLGYWYRNTSYPHSYHHNDGSISDGGIIEVSTGDRRRGHRSLETSHSSSHNSSYYHSSDFGRGGYRSQETIHSFYHNRGVYNFCVDGRGGTRSQETSHYSYLNHRARVEVDSKGGYRSHTSHFYSHKPYVSGRLFISSVSSCPIDENVHGGDRVAYSGHGASRGDISCNDDDGRLNRSRDDGDNRGDRSVDDVRCGSRSKETIHSSSINMQ